MFSYNSKDQPMPWAMKKKIFILSCICTTLIFSLAYCAIQQEREQEIVIYNNRIQIKAVPYSLSVNFADIIEISLLDQNVMEIGTGLRTNGGIEKGWARGHFERGLFFAHLNGSPTIQITRRNAKIIYINFRPNAKTEQIFNLLRIAIENFKGVKLSIIKSSMKYVNCSISGGILLFLQPFSPLCSANHLLMSNKFQSLFTQYIRWTDRADKMHCFDPTLRY